MNTLRPCGCKGVRTCLQCEKDYNITKPVLHAELQKLEAWSYCTLCERLYAGWNVWEVRAQHPTHNGAASIQLAGILVKEDFLCHDESDKLMQDLDELPWAISQSGRRKQNFGPKTNFKKRKLQNGQFKGFPATTRYIQERLRTDAALLHDFQTIEQCTLEYAPEKGASIDAHIDDCWIWGERVVTVNCLGDAVLTLTVFDAAATSVSKYNLDLVPQYADKLLTPLLSAAELQAFHKRVIRIPMPNRSLIVLYGPARYQFEHAVLREDIQTRRVCIAYREFTPMYFEPSYDAKAFEQGAIVTRNAQNFWKD